jgi:3-deoxy-7-phosphoheptulonate synthase
MLKTTDDLRLKELREIRTPAEVIQEFPRTDMAQRAPCSPPATPSTISSTAPTTASPSSSAPAPSTIPPPPSTTRSASPRCASELGGSLEIVMRVYFEKPRTTVGWKGLINDPDLDGSFDIDNGLRLARSLLLDVNNLGLPAGCEFLDMTTPQYFADLVSWGAIGARTTESQVHRELASGLSCPVGFKNGTDGNVRIALDAVKSASQPHHFLAVTKDGRLRDRLHHRQRRLPHHPARRQRPRTTTPPASRRRPPSRQVRHPPAIMIDASHANSSKKPENQPLVLDDVGAQIAGGDRRIIGVMAESNLVAGRQDLVPGKPLTYGQSITDGCIDWDDTVTVLRRLAEAVEQRRAAAALVA